MTSLFLLLLFCHVTAVKHSMKFFVTASSGVKNLPEFVGAVVVDETLIICCDSRTNTLELKYDWVEELFKNKQQHWEQLKAECSENQPNDFKDQMYNLKQRFNQSGEGHILQWITGCEWDDETEEVDGFNQYGYDGEDFLILDLKTMTWIAPKPQAVSTKLRWDAEKARINYYQNFNRLTCPQFLKNYLTYGRSFLLRKALPSVSLLQQTPSSPVRCFASGFYPERASLFWRKDGDALHEDVEHGEILPNTDGTFQMSADLKVSSVTSEDWRRYECVFQLSGVKDDIVTKLDKTAIRTNWEKPSDSVTLMVVLITLLVLALITGFIVYKLKKAQAPQPSPESNSEQLERLQESTDQNDKHAK